MPEQFYDADTYRARDSVGYLVRRLTAILTARIESAFAPHDFTLTQWSVLMHLRDGLATTASDLATAFQHDSGALTRLLDRLERRGLIVRRRSVRDRRVVALALTPAGHKTIKALLPVVVAEMNAALAPLSHAEFERFRGTLVRVLDHAQRDRPAAERGETPATHKPGKTAPQAKAPARPRARTRATARRA
jgi:DNA-binding MarR family transcriptional regulator